MSTSSKYVAVVRINPTGDKSIEPGEAVPKLTPALRDQYLERGDIRLADDDSDHAKRRAAEVDRTSAIATDDAPIGQDISLYRSKATKTADEPVVDDTPAGDGDTNPDA